MIWWTSPSAHRPRRLLDGGWLVLSQDLFDEILAHPVPLDQRVLRALTSSFALDLYAWLTYRLSRLRHPVAIPWPELAQQLGSQQRALRTFRQQTRRALGRIRLFYPQLRYHASTDCLLLYPGATHVAPRRSR
jgi:hypothetical protein